ncbi:MAG: integral rane protein [Amycolatopsis sp.]|jgi:drug/metabolite transporter (DMT)-like permease|uniref:DMT family transporter n=1 Tax=Amycolatopsis sp. TaxID=37632 RepID=UPI0026327255|nr:DMT family transporter [Amycolatopsis sp.]MCU1686534.1 integral rane protein [Amycolatopsis sp.]
MWWGLLCALLAAAAYGVSSVMQAIAARSASDDSYGVDPRLLLRILGQWHYIVGLVLDVLGFAAQIVALRVLPLFVVQSALAASLAVTALFTLTLGIRLGRREWGAIAVVVAGLALLGTSAESEGSKPVGTTFHLVLIGAVLVLCAAGVAAGKASPRIRTPALGLVAGLSFGLVAIAGRIIPSLAPLDLLRDPAFYTVAVAGVAAMLFYASALQRGSVTTATAMMVIGETVFPALVGIIVLGDRTKPGFALVAAAGFALAVAAALALARFGELKPAKTQEPVSETDVH